VLATLCLSLRLGRPGEVGEDPATARDGEAALDPFSQLAVGLRLRRVRDLAKLLDQPCLPPVDRRLVAGPIVVVGDLVLLNVVDREGDSDNACERHREKEPEADPDTKQRPVELVARDVLAGLGEDDGRILFAHFGAPDCASPALRRK
jgi:hypothetical protein